MLLAPAVNLHRTPVGGRTFEYFSEDPELTATLAVATVRAVQAHDVAVTVKHFVGNDTEIDRHTVDVVIDERVLRELYLRPFEACVKEADAWGVMSAYNRLDGEFCAANHHLLDDILRDEWGFDGFVVSDWFGAHDAAGSINGGLSIEMPGPARVHGHRLAAAIEAGEVSETTLDRLVRDVLVLALRTKAAERPADAPEISVDDPTERALAKSVAIAGTVLATNDGLLPLDPATTPRIAVIGPNAKVTRIMGGGSSAVKSLPYRSILDALGDRFETVVHQTGWNIDKYAPLPSPGQLIGPDGEPGIDVRFVNGPDLDATPAHIGRSDTLSLRYLGSFPDGVDPRAATLLVRGSFVPSVDGVHEVGLVVTGAARAAVGGRSIVELDDTLPKSEAFFGNGSTEQRISLDLRAGEPVSVEVDLPLGRAFCGLRVGFAEPVAPDAFERAVAAAAEADAVIVVAGTNDDHETEGNDRTDIALPGRQNEFIEAAAAVNDRVVVVVNAGSPVSMPWLDSVNAVLLPFSAAWRSPRLSPTSSPARPTPVAVFPSRSPSDSRTPRPGRTIDRSTACRPTARASAWATGVTIGPASSRCFPSVTACRTARPSGASLPSEPVIMRRVSPVSSPSPNRSPAVATDRPPWWCRAMSHRSTIRSTASQRR